MSQVKAPSPASPSPNPSKSSHSRTFARLIRKSPATGFLLPVAVGSLVWGFQIFAAPRWIEPSNSETLSFYESLVEGEDEVQENRSKPTRTTTNSLTIPASYPEISANLTETDPELEAEDEDDPEPSSPSGRSENLPYNINPETRLVQAQIPEFKVLEERYTAIMQRQQRYQQMAYDYYRWDYAAAWAALVSGLIFAIAAGSRILALEQKEVDPFIRNVSVSALATAAFFGTFMPGGLKFEEGRTMSWDLHREHKHLAREIEFFVATGGVISDQNPDSASEFTRIDMNRFIAYVDRRMHSLNQYPISFNRSLIGNISNIETTLFPQRPSSSN